MLSHGNVWLAIDQLAARNGMSTSGLAKRAGLDRTTFNKSKRVARDGRARWPSTESLAKVLEATGETLDALFELIETNSGNGRAPQRRTVPLLGMAQAGVGGFFDDGGFPKGVGWDEVAFPNASTDSVYALEVSGESMQPLYRDGDLIIVAPAENVRRGDRVVVRTNDGEVMAKVLYRQTARMLELLSLNPEHENRTLKMSDIAWLARIVWASQ